MKYLFAALACFSLVSTAVSSTLTDTTTFWSKAANDTFNFQAYSGYEDIDWYYDKGTAAMYYSLWQGNKLPWTDKSVPLIIWLQGGPGGSSQFGCFNELGPLALSKGTNKPVPNPWAWNSFGHLLCPDQPIGVGFSYNKNDKKVDNTPQAADHFMNFLSNFFKNNPSLGLGTNPLYLAGESYAGHYIPAFAERILTNT